MSHKTLVKIAIIMIFVFGITVLIYPLLFNPEDKSKTPLEAPPVPPAVAPIGK